MPPRRLLPNQIDALWSAVSSASDTASNIIIELLDQRAWAVRQLTAAADINRAINQTWSDRSRGPRADIGHASPRHADQPQRPRQRLPFGRTAGRAIPLYESTLADRERVLGADHPDTLTSRNNLARAYHSAGGWPSDPAVRETLAERERVLGRRPPRHPDQPQTSWPSPTSRPGIWPAIPLYEQTLAEHERVLGADHPDTLASRNNLANAYRSAGDSPTPSRCMRQSLADHERVLGADHPDTLTSRNNLAHVYHSAGRLAAPSRCSSRPLPTASGSWAPTTPHTLTSRNNLAYAYQSAGRPRRSHPAARAAPSPTASGSWAPTTPTR